MSFVVSVTVPYPEAFESLLYQPQLRIVLEFANPFARIKSVVLVRE